MRGEAVSLCGSSDQQSNCQKNNSFIATFTPFLNHFLTISSCIFPPHTYIINACIGNESIHAHIFTVIENTPCFPLSFSARRCYRHLQSEVFGCTLCSRAK